MPSRSLFERLNARREELESCRNTTENTWQEIADNLLGRRDFTVVRTPGQQRMQQIYDDTSKVSSSLLSGAIHSLLTSPAARWFELRFEDPRLQDIGDATAWLKLVEKRLYAALGAPSANFHAQLSETYIDLINFGTGALFIDDVPGVGIQFSARPLQELYLAEDPSGRIDTIIRKFQLTARQAVTLWGEDAKSANSALNGNKSEDKNDYVQLILPSEDLSVGNVDVSGMPWASFHLSLADRAVLSTGGFHEMPMATPRWEKDAGEVYGRGPGWNALSNQKSLNLIMKTTLRAGQLSVAPPLMVDSEAVLPGDLSFAPYAVIPINAVMSMMSPPIIPLESGSNFQVSEMLISDRRKAVQDSFHHQLIETIRDPRMTATQVLELSAQMQRHLAPILGRMQTELLEPIIERVFAIEARAGRLPDAPPEIADQNIKIDYVSPVARAQQTSDARAILDFWGATANLGAAVPDVFDVINFDNQVRDLAESLGVPPTGIRDPREVARRRQAAAEIAAQQQAEQQAVTATDQIAKLAKAMPQRSAA